MLFAKAKDKQFWKTVQTSDDYRDFRDELFYLYDAFCKDEIAALKYSEYKIFFQSGSRKEYETSYFSRRTRLNTCALLSLIYPEEDTYFDKLQDVIWAILDEYCWALPAHVHIEDGNDNNFLDLFACETGFALSEIYYLLQDRLEDLIKSRIRAEINRRIVHAYQTRHFFWETHDNNWAAVCAGSIGVTLMYMRPDLFYGLKPRLDATIEAFLSSYKSDGACREGHGYWVYGFGFFVYYADLLKQFTNGACDYFAQPRIKTIATFQQKIFLRGNITVSFADGAIHGAHMIGLTHYLKKQYPDDVELLDMRFRDTRLGGGGDSCGRWCHAIRSIVFFEPRYCHMPEKPEATYYLSDSAWYIKKCSRYCFATKAGDNDEPHNHNDIGSFILAAEDDQILCDLGAGEYTRQYFDPETRYSFLCNSSLGHSVPIINGCAQKEGKQYCGTMRREADDVVLSIAHAYDVPALSALERRFSLTDDTVTLTDTFCFSTDQNTVTERFITKYTPALGEGSVQAGPLCITYDASLWKADVKTDTFTRHAVEQGIIKDTVYCIDFTARQQPDTFTATIQVN